MSLEIAAKKIAAKGRHGDSLLVHMHPQEVAGLQALARAQGTTLTVNPETGLPEAFSLKSLLPMIASAVGGYFGGPWGGAAAGAATTKAMGGSDTSALMSGLGGYMGAGSMGAAAGDVAASNAAQAASDAAVQQASAEVGPELAADSVAMSNDVSQMAPAVAPEAAASPTFMQNVDAWKTRMGDNMGRAGLGALMQAQAVDPTLPPKQRIAMGIQRYGYDPRYQAGAPADSSERRQLGNVFTKGAYEDRSMYLAGGGIARLASGGAAAKPASTTGGYRPEQVYGAGKTGAYDPTGTYGAGATTTPWTPPTDMPATAVDTSRMYSYDPNTRVFTANPAWRQAQDVAAAAAAAEDAAKSHAGTIGTWEQNVNKSLPSWTAPAQSRIWNQGISGLGGLPGVGSGNPLGGGFSLGFAQGGITGLGGYSDGGRLLRGPGDGVSDSIPATIGGTQPARLADSEFVVPARIVSELGNGSTEAGARKLYAMLDRVQAARAKTIGKGKIAVDSKADRHLPA